MLVVSAESQIVRKHVLTAGDIAVETSNEILGCCEKDGDSATWGSPSPCGEDSDKWFNFDSKGNEMRSLALLKLRAINQCQTKINNMRYQDALAHGDNYDQLLNLA